MHGAHEDGSLNAYHRFHRSIRNMQHRLFRSIIVCLFLSGTSAFTVPTFGTARPGCELKCGNVTIPFPFGIGQAGCFLDDWFEIVCDRNSTVPILRKLNLKVLNISLPAYYTTNSTSPSETTYGLHDGTVKVNLPIVRHQCSGFGPSPRPVSLHSSPYSFSQPGNFFAAVGCNNLAVMAEGASNVVGCASRCDKGGLGNISNCSGISCCRTTIPSGLRAFDVKFKRISDDDAVTTGEECGFAFLADKQWFGFNEMKDLRALRGMEHVPGVLEWGIPEVMVSQIGLSGGSDSYGCEYYGESDSEGLPKLYRCYCRSGHVGNAYLSDCQDIDECKDPALNNCPWMCENRQGSYDCVDSDWMVRFVAIGIVVGLVAIALILLLWRLCRVMKKRKMRKLKERFFKRNGGILLKQQLSSSEGNHVGAGKVFNSKELEKATNNFSKERILGQGGQGTVYKGMLEDGRIVAVKKSLGIVANVGKVEQFINELVILSQVNHRNVVKLLGYCLETQLPLLVYEFIPNKTLSHYLHDPKKELTLSWAMRVRIAAEVAGALSYLHSSASIPIYHRDIKSTNIMLDENYRAKVADFGISKFAAIDQNHVTTQVRGTFGYLDPEYFQSCQFTDKSDVYSFGVVLAELLTGQVPISIVRPEEYRGLATYFVLSMEENHLLDIVDSEVLKQGKEGEVMAVAYLAKRCLDLKGKRRPSMKVVATELERIRMLGNPSRNVQNHSEIDFSSNKTSWDDVRTSMRSDLDVDLISFPDVHPLLDIESW